MTIIKKYNSDNLIISKQFFVLIILVFALLLIGLPNTLKGQSNTPLYFTKYLITETTSKCISKVEIANLILKNKETIEKLSLDNPQNQLKKSELDSIKFIWPLRTTSDLFKYNYYAITVFVDHDTMANSLLDYNNGKRTYDGHGGTDIIPWPYPWYQMDSSLVEVVATADGVIIGKEDGHFDRSCGSSDTAKANYVSIYHANKTITWYIHLKNNSVTSKNVGDSIKTGEYLGLIGSSGISSGPHLHFQVLDSLYNTIDPWLGPTNSTIEESLWKEQKPYYHSRINEISSHFNAPIFPECPKTEILNLQNEFTPGDTVYLASFYQDILKDQISKYTLCKPNGDIWYEWEYTFTQATHYPAFYIWIYFTFPADVEKGVWEYSVEYNDVNYIYNFTIVQPTSIKEAVQSTFEFKLNENYPNPFNPETTISFSLHEDSYVTLMIYNILGQEVKKLLTNNRIVGNHSIVWNGKDNFENDIPSGIYIYKLTAQSIPTSNVFSSSKKMLLIK